jgi:hypothetical protein
MNNWREIAIISFVVYVTMNLLPEVFVATTGYIIDLNNRLDPNDVVLVGFILIGSAQMFLGMSLVVQQARSNKQ